VEGEAFWVQVTDTGPGIPLDEQDKLFTPFFRGKLSRREPEGMGLGLPIVRDLVIAHGGRIEVKSTPGQGSCFTFWIPQDIPSSSKG
jgi:signal transduction histidine kinase